MIRRREGSSSPTFHPKEQSTQPFFSEIIESLPSAPHPFRNQDADKTSNSSDPTLQILYGQPWKHGHVNTEKKTKPYTWKEFGSGKASVSHALEKSSPKEES